MPSTKKETYNMNLLKHLYQCCSEDTVNIEKFLSIYPDNQELKTELKALEDFGYIRVVYASGKIYEIYFLDKGIDYVKTL